jgi:hypothetical protein
VDSVPDPLLCRKFVEELATLNMLMKITFHKSKEFRGQLSGLCLGPVKTIK